MNKRNRKAFSCVLIVTIVGFFFSTFFCLAAYLKYIENSDGAFGTIGLRSYFHCGTGSETDPYVITRPRHLYNLSRLQALGVFPEKKYFQLGYDLDNNGSLEFYENDSSTTTSDDLDMSSYNASSDILTITSIGSEATPFYGVFEGNGLVIKNLIVDASLEDSGLFGYTASRSIVRNLVLDNVHIINDGYSSDLESLYGTENGVTFKKNSKFNIKQGTREVIYAYDENGNSKIEKDTENESYNSTNTLSFEIHYPEKREHDENLYKLPEFSFNVISTESTKAFSYTLLSSDVFLSKTIDSDKEIYTLKDSSSDVSDIFSYFDSYKKEDGSTNSDVSYPMTLAMTLSLVANYVDSNSVCHSRVVAALNLSFEKLLENSSFITMYVQPRETEHENNMGLVIGHCDGSCQNVYVHDGYFKMNSKSANTAVNQNSMTGFIGLIGPSVKNSASSASKGNIATTGKDVGVLDFTDIYTSIVGGSSFNTVTEDNQKYYTYTPVENNQYLEFLRYNSQSNTVRYTNASNSIALIGKKVIKDDDTHNRGLGVFTIATDYQDGGTGSMKFNRIDKSTIVKSKTPSSQGTTTYDLYDSENVFYSTYEYNAENASSLYGSSSAITHIMNLIEDPDSEDVDRIISPGYHIPVSSTISSQKYYEAYYNYLFRFHLDETRSDFYFSDLDDSSIGGNFLNNYFSYKLVDETGEAIAQDSSQFGLMIKNKKKQNISQLTTNFYLDGSGDHMFVQGTDETSYYVSNSINFEIKTEYANVTVLASNKENSNNYESSGSMLGVYKLPEQLMTPSGETAMVPTKDGTKEMTWLDPDYGMILPANKAISFYEYKTNDGVGQIGSYKLDSSYFNDEHVVTSTNNSSIYVNTSNDSAYLKHPIFAHTFKLPKGRYCLGSAIGSAYVYYICAQGQDEGDISLSANVYSNINIVDDMDFVKKASNKDKPYFSIQDGVVTANTDNIKAQRLFLIFDSGNISHFNAATKNNTNLFELNMKYDETNNKFVFSLGSDSDMSSIASLTLTNYGVLENIGATQTTVDFFGTITQEKKITYTYKG